MQELAGRVAVVTGGASGIGRGMAGAFLERGMKVVLADVEAEALAATTAELSAAGGDVVGVECDVSNAESVEALRDETLSQFGAAHVLCNNAGVAGGSGGATWEAPQADWDWGLGVNLMGVVYGIRSFVPVMIEQGAPAHVVNTASVAAFGPMPADPAYSASKAGIVNFTESCKPLHDAFDIRVMAVCPGITDTAIVPRDAEWLQPAMQAVKMLAPAEIAAAVCRPLTDAAPFGGYVTVQNEPLEA